MLYLLSKAFWLIVQPRHSLILLLGLGTALLFTRWRPLGHGLAALALLLISSIAVLPVGRWFLAPLENRFPPLRQMPARVDGVIMLGGPCGAPHAPERGTAAINPHTDQFTVFADLARRYPHAKLVFAGADDICGTLQRMGTDMSRVILEQTSRNTFENVVNAKALVHPMPDEIWVLVTPAFHMPRSVGLFRAQNWHVVPDPVDYRTGTGLDIPSFGIDVANNLDQLSVALKEWIGMFANRLLGHSEHYFPSPSQSSSIN